MAIHVHKYGGSSVADEGKLSAVADRVVRAKEAGHDLVVVVSAMGKTTDELLALARRVHPDPPRRELDMLTSVGERISMALLSMAIQQRGHDAISFTGSQSGIITNDRHSDARIIEVRPFRISDELCRGRIVIVAGYQGMSYRREITTLGRGGSDTTAVALAAALDAESCEIYGDVDGVYTADPKLVTQARRIDALGYAEMQELAESGAKVLNASAVEFAKDRGIALFVRRADGQGGETIVRSQVPHGPGQVVGIAHESDVRILTIDHKQGLMDDAVLAFFDELGIQGKQLTFQADKAALVTSREHLEDTQGFRLKLSQRFGQSVQLIDNMAAVSLIGAGINQSFANLRKMLKILAAEHVQPQWLHTSSFRITALLEQSLLEQAISSLHEAFIESDRTNPSC